MIIDVNFSASLDADSQVRLTLTRTTRESLLLIAYNSKVLQDVCHQTPVAAKLLGEEGARVLHARLSDIKAANSVFDIPVGVCYINDNVCEYKFKNILSIQMVQNYGEAGRDKLFDWESVYRAKIVRINDVA